MTTPLGVIFRPDYQPSALRGVAAAADAAGVDELWVWEDCFQQGGVAQAAVALTASERLVVGIGLVPAPLRNVAAAAMEFATLDAMFPGRIRIAVGHGVQSWMRQAGAAVASPLTLLREYVGALRALLAGETVTVEGRYVTLSDVRLEYAPARPTPVLVGGTGPKTLRLAGEIADGVLFDSRYSVDGLREAIAHVTAGRADAVGANPFTTSLFLSCVPGPDAAPRLGAEARRHGLDDEADFGVGGSPEEVAAGVRRYLDLGIDAVALQSDGGLDGMAEFVAAAGATATALRR